MSRRPLLKIPTRPYPTRRWALGYGAGWRTSKRTACAAVPLTETLSQVKSALQEGGHRLRMHKCKAWLAGWDDIPDKQVPREAGELLQQVPRAMGGLALLEEGAAQGDSIATVKRS